jgi:prepilin-type N-terminal cleavage/methylation domain-containing protein
MDDPEMKMILRIGNNPIRKSNDPRSSRAFTLIELILVMAILTIAVALVTPILSRFFGGRSVESEVTRFVALTRHGQSRAVSEGVPMMLWIDVRNGSYGLKQEPGYTDSDPKADEYTVAEGIKIDIAKANPVTRIAKSQTARVANGQGTRAGNKLPAVHFSPDGTIVSAMSVAGISFQEGDNSPVWIGPSASRLTYEVQDQKTITANAIARR